MTSPAKSASLNEAYFRSLIEDALDIITVTDRNGTIQYASPANLRVLGYEPEELVGTNAFSLVHPDDRLRCMKEWNDGLLQPGHAHIIHFRYRHKNGSWLTLEAIGRYVDDASGPPRIVLNSRDVTDRQSAAKQLHEMEDMYRQILDTIAEMVFVKGPKSKIIWANKALRDFYAMTNEQLRGMIDSPNNEPDYTQKYVKDDAQVFDTGQPLDIACEPVNRHDGVTRYFHTMKSAVLNADGKVAMMVGVSRDITERMKLQAVVRQTEKMSAVGQLASGVAHEINNPLSVIIGFAQAMLARLVPTDALYAAAQSIERESLRCKNLVQELLTFSRERKPEATVEAPASIVESALHLVDTQARIMKVTVQRLFSPDLPLIQADRTQLAQVIINLCNNAMDAMPDGGLLTVSLKRADAMVEIRVTDTGTGIPTEIQDRVFEPFFTTKDVGKGTGLGLSLAYEIIKKHHGQIDFESTLGKGTTFTIRLPAAASAATTAS